MEIALTILGGVLGIIGAFAGAWAANRYERRTNIIETKKKTAIDLYNEYQSSEMQRARIEARNILTANQNSEKIQSLSELRNSLDVEEWTYISMVITFFEKIGILLEHDYIDSSLARKLLQYDFRYWHEKYFINLVIGGKQSQSQWWNAIQYLVKEWQTS